MDAVNPILAALGRSLVEAMAAHAIGDHVTVEAALERASRIAGRLLDAVGGTESMGTELGENAMSLLSEIEGIELNDGHAVIFEALARAVALAVIVATIANSSNPFAPADDAEGSSEGIAPVVAPIRPVLA